MARLPADGSPPAASLARELDRAANQKDAWASGLYWHTDLDAARAEAKRQEKPILSLRLLGRLDEEMSCANSRFFRTALYPDPAVNKLLRERYVLHWQSERPVPIATIDFGDGRVIRRPITGNSIHYVLDADANVLDALPGLYAPGEFARQLRASADHGDVVAFSPGEMRAGLIARHHVEQARRAAARRNGAPALRLAPPPLPPEGFDPAEPAQMPASPAGQAGRLSASKLIGEFQTLREVARVDPIRDAEPLAAQLGPIASQLVREARLSEPSLAVLLSKLPSHVAADAQRVDALVAQFEESLARDTAFNEFHLRQLLRDWLASGAGDGGPAAFEALNQRVYAELFLTPADDPWLGLRGGDAYLALSGEASGIAD